MATTRPLNTATLDAAARDLAGQWFLPTRYSRNNPDLPVMGREWVLDTLYRADFKDEHEHLLKGLRGQLGADALKEFDAAAKERFTPRDDAVFEGLLAEKLAVNPAGEHIKGTTGRTIVGQRVVGKKVIEVETPNSIRRRKLLGLGKEHRETTIRVVANEVPVYAGEPEEGGYSSFMDFLRDQSGALVTNLSAEMTVLGLDAALDALEEGTSGAILEGRSGAQPADPDAATTGTLLFTLPYSDPAFLAAADQADGTVQAAADTITDDSSADATGTLGYCRLGSSNDGASMLDPHIDGEAGTSGADFNFNTVSIVSGATVSMTSHTVTWSQGPTAT